MNASLLSAIICTHNPRPASLARTLDGLARQTLPRDAWELLVIDNASSPALERTTLGAASDLTARVIREEQLGLNHARNRGVAEARGDLVIFVDDDNVLDPGYLAAAREIADAWQMLGAWSGHLEPEFEAPPPEWTKPFWQHLAIREVTRASWSNLLQLNDSTPFGAGMVLRTALARDYAAMCESDPRRALMGRRGTGLSGSEDVDLAFYICSRGHGVGVFPQLRLIHLMPPGRLSEEYLLKMIRGTYHGHIILQHLWDQLPPRSTKSRGQRLLERYYLARIPRRDREVELARKGGIAAAYDEIARANRGAA